MSVLIKGMEMPKDCVYCPGAHWNKLDEITGCEIAHGKKFVKEEDKDFWENKRPSWCPLVEVPTPHGRLIDASQFEVFGYDAIEGRFDEGVAFVLNRIDDAPTVIEEEE